MISMDKMFVTQDTVYIGNGKIKLPCKKLTLIKDTLTISVKNNDVPDYNQKKILEHDIVNTTDVINFSQEKEINNPVIIKKSYLPKCILDSFEHTDIPQINLDLDGSIIILKDDELDKECTKNQIMTSHTNFCVMFNMEKVISEILHSYLINKSINYMDTPTKEKILEQITIDFPRMEIRYNNKKCKTIFEFKTHIEKYNSFAHDTMFTLYYLIIMLSTQASFYYPFNAVHSVYSLPDTGIHILPSDDYPLVNIIDNGDSVDIIFKKVLRYFNINSQETITKFHTYMVISIDLYEEPDGYIFYGKRYCQYNTGMLYWIKETNLLVI
ncbi:putative ORFan [Tupanvirus deep ocean]|uniref:ORFan n=2 Tax=Tupanvirus TaxID=2094720 RepID=A0AC62A713_9VIRU|nr:putative ORFan [Tupanvirus deep ocean]QKU33580.1 putative ORFan [Tupanvirus deep ocean]